MHEVIFSLRKAPGKPGPAQQTASEVGEINVEGSRRFDRQGLFHLGLGGGLKAHGIPGIIRSGINMGHIKLVADVAVAGIERVDLRLQLRHLGNSLTERIGDNMVCYRDHHRILQRRTMLLLPLGHISRRTGQVGGAIILLHGAADAFHHLAVFIAIKNIGRQILRQCGGRDQQDSQNGHP